VHSAINVTNDYRDIFDLNREARTIMMTNLCDHAGTHQGIRAKNITDNFAREVKPQQLHHFFNAHICNLDNIDLFYQFYVENVLMQQTVDFLFHNHDVYSPEPIGQKREWIQKWMKSEHCTFAEWFVAFSTAAMLIYDTVNSCTIDTFKNAKNLSC
jgi:hypothetical protein